jgi:hypothetical protein
VFEERPDAESLGDVCELNQGDLVSILYWPSRVKRQPANELVRPVRARGDGSMIGQRPAGRIGRLTGCRCTFRA